VEDTPSLLEVDMFHILVSRFILFFILILLLLSMDFSVLYPVDSPALSVHLHESNDYT